MKKFFTMVLIATCVIFLLSMCGNSVKCPDCGTKFDPEKHKTSLSDALPAAAQGASVGKEIGKVFSKKGGGVVGAGVGAVIGGLCVGDLKCPKCGKIFNDPRKK